MSTQPEQLIAHCDELMRPSQSKITLLQKKYNGRFQRRRGGTVSNVGTTRERPGVRCKHCYTSRYEVRCDQLASRPTP